MTVHPSRIRIRHSVRFRAIGGDRYPLRVAEAYDGNHCEGDVWIAAKEAAARA
jgi:hypothetical protein